MCGSSRVRPEKNPLILAIAPAMKSTAVCIGLVMARLIPFHTLTAVDLIALNVPRVFVFMESQTPPMVVFTAFMMISTPNLRAVQ